ncbi:DUF4340 domain-containing protein [Leptospira sarikeiensis]|uniref:DUF4340 domain-containing protein n=1 Tax=Leptospira sarikeiensis TaxID=2484943 RepID=A0A4R9KAC7_9LEPT|nr:DUF4340 domain-containing protein [Leptospira sarikeiensis]TGL62764.1 DUF4340 domain-containing protein [Leptospira sarikeiensis]
MRNKLYLFGLVVVLLFLAFFLLEKTKEDATEIQYWKLSLDRIEYYPPSEEWREKTGEKFYPQPFTISVKDGIKKGEKFFTVSNKDLETGKDIEYEGGYNSENTIRDFGVYRVKGTDEVLPGIEIKESLQVGEGSPKLVLYSGNISKTLKIGKKHSLGSTRVVLDDAPVRNVLTSSSYLFDRFQKGPQDFRQKSILTLNKEYVKEISYIDENGTSIKIDNTPYEANSVKKNFWRRLSGEIILLEPKLGEDLFRYMTGLKVENFPDDENGAGFGIGNILAPGSEKSEFSLASVKVSISDGNEIVYRFHKETSIGDKKLTPVIRIVNSTFKEPPVYIVENAFVQIQSAALAIKNAKAIVKAPKVKAGKASQKK